jgi:hypothetical protein
LTWYSNKHLKYFWDYGHPVSGLARERSNATPETVTSGGSGFGVMAMVAAVSRGLYNESTRSAKNSNYCFIPKKYWHQNFTGHFPTG